MTGSRSTATTLAPLTDVISVAGALSAGDFARAAAQGFQTIVNNRPDGEEPGQLTAREEREMARAAGLAYIYLPAAKHEVLEPHFVDALEATLAGIEGPLLLHCRSGLRSTIAWAAVQVRAGRAIEAVLSAAHAAGFDLAAVRDEIADFAPQRRVMDTAQNCQAAA